MVLPPQELALSFGRAASRAATTCSRGLALAALLTAPVGIDAQDRFPLGPGPYDPAVPTVAAIRGFPTGQGFSTYREIERVLDAIDEASDRIRIESYGVSVEGRPLRIAWISSPDNLARLDELRRANVALADGAPGPPELADRPLFAWLSFGVHGDEGGSTETGLELVYHLAASRAPTTEALLDDLVVAVDPVLNPDGHERYAVWYRAVADSGGNPRPSAREHRPPWAPGRTNHWLFDLNRDWAWGVMPETRARVVAYRSTLPQLHVDVHEMEPESTYFFFPAANPVHAFYPASTTAWAEVFGEANAAVFDARGWAFYTEESFDLFYPGYGDSWPSFFGATGMTYEQAGGRRAGIALDRPDRARLTLADRVEHHLVAVLTTLETAAERRVERVADFIDFWRPETRRLPSAPAAWLVPPARDARPLAEHLVRQGVVVDTLEVSIGTGGLDPFPGTAPRDSLPAGTYLVSSDQPLGRYAAALLSPRAALPDTTGYYDITGWALPLLHDIDAWRAETAPRAPRGRWSSASRPVASTPPAIEGAVAIAWPYETSADAVAAARLLADGVSVRVADRPFRSGGTAFGRGTFLVLLDEADRAAPLWRLLEQAGARPALLRSHRTDEGIDLGSDRMRLVRAPRIAIASGPGTTPISVGAAWWLLAGHAGLPVDVVRAGDLAAAPGEDSETSAGADREPLDLDPYTAIVLPDAPEPGALETAVGSAGARRLTAWVRAGGTLVGIRNGAAWLAADRSGISSFTIAPEPAPDEETRRAPRAVRDLDDVRSRIPGTLVGATVDTTSVLGYGFPDRDTTVLVRDPPEFDLAERGNALVYADADPRSGYLPADARARLPGTPYALLERLGRGHVVLFADDPGFRGILHGLRRAYLNAVLLVSGS